MAIKISKEEKNEMREQAKEMIRKAHISIFAAEVMIKELGKK